MGATQDRGAAGEALAAAWFELRGDRVLGRNLRLGGREVDLLVQSGTVLAVVEVKLRSRSDYGGAAAAVDARKRARLLDAARALLSRGASEVRVDVVTLDLEPDGLRLRHIPNAVTEG
jgi:putative endonuclease